MLRRTKWIYPGAPSTRVLPLSPGLPQVIRADAALTPEGLPPCGLYATSSCRGDGSTLKERLQALSTVGSVSVSRNGSASQAAGTRADVCGVEGVSFPIRVISCRRVLLPAWWRPIAANREACTLLPILGPISQILVFEVKSFPKMIACISHGDIH